MLQKQFFGCIRHAAAIFVHAISCHGRGECGGWRGGALHERVLRLRTGPKQFCEGGSSRHNADEGLGAAGRGWTHRDTNTDAETDAEAETNIDIDTDTYTQTL